MNRCVSNIVTVLSVLLLSASCVRESAPDSVKAGDPVTVTLRYGVPEMTVQTRALSDAQECAIHDLYILFFDSSTSTKTYSRYYTASELSSISPDSKHNAAGQVSLTNVPAGKYYIVGVANIASAETGGETLKAEMDALTTFAQMQSLVANLEQAENIDRVVPALLMSGVYTESSSEPTSVSEADITDNNDLPGTLHLRRADARYHFVIKNGNPSVITSFEPTSWQVYNIPSGAPVMENTTPDLQSLTYATSRENIQFDKSVADQVSFDFYLLENLQSPKTSIPSTSTDPYNERERKTGSSYTYAPDNGTYVVLKANLEMQMTDESGNPYIRSAEVQYTIHLGYCEGSTTLEKANDFNCRRNTKYTYTVSIQNVDKIILEAKQQGELQPGAEGIVTDAIGGENIVLDAHYATFNISVTPKEISNMSYLLRTPFGTYSPEDGYTALDPTSEDCTWIRFAETTDMDTLVPYSQTVDTKAEAVDGKKWLMNLQEVPETYSDASDDTPRYFTVFVDEYVYSGKTPGEYVNKSARELFLYTAGNISSDGASVYITGKYHITQRSIQTYYSDSSTNMLGIEHTDETKGRNLNWSVGTSGLNSNSGWVNVTSSWAGIVGKSWDTYAQLTVPDDLGYSTFQMNTTTSRTINKHDEDQTTTDCYEYIRACLSRNRDEDRDGIIDAEEIKWYLPTVTQYMMIFLGAAVLEHPLFDAATIPEDVDVSTINVNNAYHFGSSDRKKLFAEEGCSVNHIYWTNDGVAKWCRNIRCVRNLRNSSSGGTDMTLSGISTLPDKPYVHNTTDRTMEMNLNPLCLRSPIHSWLSLHHGFDYSVNSPSKKFKYGKTPIGMGSRANWREVLPTNSILAEYYEEDDASDKGKWRVPNQIELNLLWIDGKRDRTYISSTAWKFNQNYYYYIHPSVSYMSLWDWAYVLPVRDIE